MYEIVPVDMGIREIVVDFITENWGSSIIITKGKIHKAEELQGFAVLSNGEIKALITYNVADKECEITSLDSFIKNQGIGIMLIEKEISSIFRTSYENNNLSGVVLLKQGNNVLFSEAYGYAHKGYYLKDDTAVVILANQDCNV